VRRRPIPVLSFFKTVREEMEESIPFCLTSHITRGVRKHHRPQNLINTLEMEGKTVPSSKTIIPALFKKVSSKIKIS
jgi:hypothetical protein